MPSFKIGDFVEVYVPSGLNLTDRRAFSAGWGGSMMQLCVGKTGEVIMGPQRRQGFADSYKIRFDNEDTWWWDARYMIKINDETIEESDFVSILE